MEKGIKANVSNGKNELSMNKITVLTIIAILVAGLSLFATYQGIFSADRSPKAEVISTFGETVKLHSVGLYKNDSVSGAAQEIGQDIVTLAIGIPMLLLALFLFRKGKMKGKLFLTGMFGYFLYTYAAMSFLTIYNRLFLVYVALFSLSLYGFIICLLTIDRTKLSEMTSAKLPRKFIGSVLIFISAMLALMWLGRIVPSLQNGVPPIGLEHYSTLVIQTLDLGVIVPTSFLVGILVIRRNSFGTMMASVFIIKAAMLITAIESMTLVMIRNGANVATLELFIFPLFGILTYFCLYLLLKNIEDLR